MGKVEAAENGIEQMLIPNDMITQDENGVPIETESKLAILAGEPGQLVPFGIAFNWEEIKGTKEYTKETLQERVKFLVDKATKAAIEAGQYLKSDSPGAAEAIGERLATAKICAEGVGHLHRRSTWVDYEEFDSAYKQYADTRKIDAEFRKLKLTKAIESQKRIVTETTAKVKVAAEKASAIAEGQQAIQESKKLLQTAEAEAAGLKTAYDKVYAILDHLDGGEDPEHIKVLVENPRAVWAKLEEAFTSMNRKPVASLDTAITDEAAIAKDEYTIFQGAVDEAKATVSDMEKALLEVSGAEPTPEGKETAGEQEQGEKGASERKQKEEEARKIKQKEEEERQAARQKAVDSAERLKSSSNNGAWARDAFIGAAAGISTLTAAAFATSAAIGGAGGVAAGSAAAGGTAAGGLALLSAAESISVTIPEVAQVIAEIDSDMALEILLESAPRPPTSLGPPVPKGTLDGPQLGRRSSILSRDLSSDKEWVFQAIGPAFERAFLEACMISIGIARHTMAI
ncbi:hypothetical protein HRG_001856 [Hirsutella rhossiliensis]|uniref:Uncharacterized protein n=1 Tax=Hirsutella rhossiliensis TaxID=111463 RepID=A0A9P8N895_9HYPO|nr:uncharacterized protein HRG_01856 [Hirsutella rhossiliensis]KAH0966447.1 hypothetical protein HRG_01856 [Hirsutella rhossiliensis]